jgi:chromosome segregation ATPase
MKKLDINSILIIFLLATSLFFGYKWYFERSSESKKRVKELEEKFREIQKQKAENLKEILFWRERFDSLRVEDSVLVGKIAQLEEKRKQAEIDANRSKANLQRLREELEKTRKKIEAFKKNPPNRSGDLLLQSLKINSK